VRLIIAWRRLRRSAIDRAEHAVDLLAGELQAADGVAHRGRLRQFPAVVEDTRRSETITAIKPSPSIGSSGPEPRLLISSALLAESVGGLLGCESLIPASDEFESARLARLLRDQAPGRSFWWLKWKKLEA
jgi:hypothetical protein